MGTDSNAIRLLILDDSQNDAEHLVSLLRNAGHATRAHRITSVEDLQECLQQTWDLCLAVPQTSFMSATDACELITRQSRDIPFLLISPEAGEQARTEGMRSGMRDVIPEGAEAVLTMVVKRELASLEARRQLRIAEQSLREAEKRCQLLLDSSVDAIAYVHDGMHIYANRSYIRLFGYEDPDDLAAEPMVGLIASKDQATFKTFLRSYSAQGDKNEMRCSGIDVDGKEFPIMLTFTPASYDGEPCTQVVIRAETASAEFEEKLKVMASQDLVTGLYNRSYFQEQLGKVSEQAVHTGQASSLIYLSIDNFNGVQSDIGIGGSDLILSDLAQMLRQAFTEDTLIARFSDDACSILLAGKEPEAINGMLEELRRKIEATLFEANGRTVQITVSMGISSISETSPKPEEAIDRAHRLADQISQAGGNAIRIFNPLEELAHQANRGNLIALVKHALETNSFKLLFQPVISLRGDSSEHYETYLRLINSQGEEVPAADFLPAAQESGLALQIDRWVITRAIKVLSNHRAKGADTRLLLNLSSASLQDAELVRWVAGQLKASRLPPDSLIFQFNDADANTYMKQAKSLIESLHSLHCKASLSHFGCALNPYAALKHLQVDFIKIDGSFSRDLTDPDIVNALKEMVTTLHAQGKLTIVPYVDSATMMPTLWQAGVNYIQGHYLQSPSESMNYDFSAE
ncbi:bifunctional diguanylate cyclase/phosphodiesterase [Halopseudomonas pelagia]|uniref:bifunctional diguanylate cyclase/phosphodiesterase n=1 Tax=Halopseudomonas pelagia TaxID=553151 RepID=UPI0003A97441|nr:bifunctional diguanylate cyclase/phosphodiesterase [Halopseudomonas pelagia]|tara:strand:+ start:245775 stop:247844 length:2070 start_codon:yes stop_codon:yes gene_type:complete